MKNIEYYIVVQIICWSLTIVLRLLAYLNAQNMNEIKAVFFCQPKTMIQTLFDELNEDEECESQEHNDYNLLPNRPIDSQRMKLVYKVPYMIFYLILYLPHPVDFVPILSAWQH